MSSLKKKFLQGAWAALLTFCFVLSVTAVLSATILIYSNVSPIMGFGKSPTLPLLLLALLIMFGGGIAASFVSFIVLGFFWQMPKEETKLYLKRFVWFISQTVRPLS